MQTGDIMIIMKHAFGLCLKITSGFMFIISLCLINPKALAHDGLHSTDVQISGVIEVVIATDAKRTKSNRQTFIVEKSGKRHEISLRKPVAILPGTKVRAKGHRKSLTKIEDVVLYAADGGALTTTQTMLAAPLPPQIGSRKVAVFLVNFQDNRLALTTPTIASQVLNGKLSDFFRENSYGQTYLTGDVFGWYTIPLDSTACNINTLETMANQAALNEGKDLSIYHHKIYVYEGQNNISHCGYFAGMGTLGDGISPGRIDINGSDYFVKNFDVTAHELGHNLGLFHSHSLYKCEGGKAPLGLCNSAEYGDDFDTMGWGRGAHFNAYHKERLGWLNVSGTPTVKTVAVAGDYDLEVFSTQTLGVKALKILREINPVTGKNIYFYLENRQSVGFDSAIQSYYFGDYSKGAVLRMVMDGDPNGSFLVNAMAGDGQHSASNYKMNTVIPVGRFFSDAVSGWMFEIISASTTGIRVRISKKRPPVLQLASQRNVLRALPGAVVPVPVSVIAGDSALAKVQLLSAGSIICESAVAPFTCAVTAPATANSRLIIQAVAIDALGMQSQPRYIKISTDASAPSVSITAPSLGATATPGAALAISGEIFDNLGMDRMEVMLSGQKFCDYDFQGAMSGIVCSLNLPSYLANATYALQVNAYDEAGNKTTVERSIQVGTGGAPIFSLPSISLVGDLTAAVIEPYSSMTTSFAINEKPGGDGFAGYFVRKNDIDVGRFVTSASGEKFNLSFVGADNFYMRGPAASVDVTVGKIDQADRILPTVAITAPADGVTVAPLSYVNITATASDNVAITKVDFYVGGVLTCSTTFDYSCTWAVPRTKGKYYIIEIQAFDKAGNVSKKQITVNTGVTTTTTGGRRK